ncbi:hypothetical protein HJC10_22385 [Corallococcus exiguus]|uniref:hypothetical protein n=1 Tax=Corallococcus TaxID=83461 RepID=UPI000ECFDFA5|nr:MULTISPECIES: hypothetical protein [Corallococcus]NNB84636.1 hypothetical protein [Corallococcus exiguus]NNB93239.1 hypothetical protein [Corallococcus exiguus]NNC05590.1 hypothetical protein [Corallococcus exiguus]NPC49282.1 hypothetical protein [Corallococcus exiguus]RKH81411.1 hypothetical protein D7X99_19125 [Corallococcus sp. AB032C]
MTRNVKRFLAASLLSLAPSVAFAGPADLGFPDYLSQRNEYVSVREGAVELPQVRGGASIGPALENFFVSNQSGATISLGLQTVNGTFNGVYTPYPVPTANLGGFQISAPAPAPSFSQQYYWTVNPASPSTSKTCVWRADIADNAGTCTATIYYGTYGGAVCAVDTVNSFIDVNTCEAQIVTIMQ